MIQIIIIGVIIITLRSIFIATKFKGDTICTTPHLYEDDIKELFVVALSKLLVDREALLEDGRLIHRELMDTAAIDTKCDELLQEMDVVAGLIQKCINENAVKAIDQDEYISRYNSLVERHEKHKIVMTPCRKSATAYLSRQML